MEKEEYKCPIISSEPCEKMECSYSVFEKIEPFQISKEQKKLLMLLNDNGYKLDVEEIHYMPPFEKFYKMHIDLMLKDISPEIELCIKFKV